MEEYSIKFQDGSIKNGRNGLTVEEALTQCVQRLSFLNSNVPCTENCYAMMSIHRAIEELEARTKDRKDREVEGTLEV